MTNWGDIPSGAVAEHALLLALAALRNLAQWNQIIARPEQAGNRVELLGTRTLTGKRVGIHGAGRVARALHALLAPFGVPVRVFSQGIAPELVRAAQMEPAASLVDLFCGSDLLFECEALTPETRHGVRAQELAALPDGAIVVNVARAGIIDDAALLHEAASGRIRVALDVFSTEPLTTDSPWTKISNAVISPHIAGPTLDQYRDCLDLAMANLARYYVGEKLEAVVTLDVYDRST